MLGEPGLDEKSSISLFIRKPRPSTVTAEPYQSFKVVVIATAFPASSTTDTCVVLGDSCSAAPRAAAFRSISMNLLAGRCNFWLGVARAGSTVSRQACAYRLSVNCATGILLK